MMQRILLNGQTPLVPQITCVEDLEFETDAVIVTCILVVFGLLLIVGTLYDVVAVQTQTRSEPIPAVSTSSETTASLSSSISSSSVSTASSDVPVSLYTPIKTMLGTAPPGYVNSAYTTDDELKKDMDAYRPETVGTTPDGAAKHEDVNVHIPDKRDDVVVAKTDSNNKGPLEKAVLSFSAYSNGGKILSTFQASGSLSAINGIRFLSMCWVILGHTYTFSISYSDNLTTHYAEKLNEWTFSAIVYALVSVDTFFTISGILVAYLTLKQLKKMGGAKKLNWFMFYFHRFWRLTPPYMLVIMVGTVIVPYMATGPMWPGRDLVEMGPCRKYWWSNLLYINNFYGTYDETEMCMGWTWYLANDMQFYILSPLILLPLFYNFIAGAVSCAVFLVATITTTAIINHKYEYPSQWGNFFYVPPGRDDYYIQRIYFTSYCRMGPYIIGLFTGYLLYRWNCKCKIHKVLNLLCWLVCLAICCSCVYGLYSYKDDHILTQLQSDLFTSLHRTGWGVAVSWIVFACATGHGGWINDLLSWKPFIPLGRLTYCAYLIHPLVTVLFVASRRHPTFFSDYELVYLFLGTLTLSYGTAFITSLLFESPMMGLEKVFFYKQKSK